MKNYLFEIISEWSDIKGKQISIQCNSEEEAYEILSDQYWGEKVKLLGIYLNKKISKTP